MNLLILSLVTALLGEKTEKLQGGNLFLRAIKVEKKL